MNKLQKDRLLPAFAVAALLLLGCKRRSNDTPLPLPVLGQIPAFAMEDQRHTQVTDKSLHGNVLVVDFFFSSCTTSCPLLTSRMKAVQEKVKAEANHGPLPVKLVSITLDPENDTPDVLLGYAGRAGADNERWSFLTGRSEELDRVVTKGFKMAFERAPSTSGIATIMHGEWLVLVDADGVIRGYYPASDKDRMEAIVSDAIALAARAPHGGDAKPSQPTAEAMAKADGTVYHAKGTLRSFGPDHSYVNIAHDDIPGYMKAMTMSFFPKKQQDLAGFQTGERVLFDFVETEDGRRMITAIAHEPAAATAAASH